jgi:hypothetical protein
MSRPDVHVVADRESDPELFDEFFERFGTLDGLRRPVGAVGPAMSPEQIRAERIGPATVTLVLLGTCTWSKQAVDLELEAALTPAADGLPNGLMACTIDRNAERSKMPDRLKLNVKSGYARLYRLPRSVDELRGWVEAAAAGRGERSDRLKDTDERLAADLPCTDTGTW